MSRSYRKPYIKDKNHKSKQIHSRRFRRISTTLMNVFNKSLRVNVECEPFLPLKNEVTNQYDICDWWYYCNLKDRFSDGSFIWTEQEVKKACRK